MVWCLSCNAEVTAEVDDTRGFTCCTQCGVVLDETAFKVRLKVVQAVGELLRADPHSALSEASSGGIAS